MSPIAWRVRWRSLSESSPRALSREVFAVIIGLHQTAYVRLGLLPKPETIGNPQRWDFGRVKAFIKAQNAATENNHRSVTGDEDAYLKGLESGSPKKGQR
jgi:hypothetical protein